MLRLLGPAVEESEGFCDKPVQACFEPAGKETSVNWSYVGAGKGGYEKVELFNYVGEGAGNFELQDAPVPYWRRTPVCCAITVLAMVSVAVIGAVRVVDLLSDASATSITTTGVPISLVETTMPGVPAAPIASSIMPDDNLEPVDCKSAGPWSLEKREYCCRMHQLGCDSAPSPSPVPATVTTSAPALRGAATPQPAVAAAAAAGAAAAASAKPLPMMTTAAPSQPFDCRSGLEHEAQLWSKVQQDWCCKNQQLGCTIKKEVQPAYDCNDLRTVWSEERQNWCCENKQLGCQLWTKSTKVQKMQVVEEMPPAEQQPAAAMAPEGTTSHPYDCSADMADWETKWSDAKKTWCSHSCERGVACPHSH